MTISVWRYSHLALALSSFLFITLAAVTGIILSFEPINEKIPSHQVADFNKIKLAETLPVLRNTGIEITDISVDVNRFVILNGIDSNGKKTSIYVDPRTGKQLGVPPEKNKFFLWVTALHRSLFLHETGRFFIGLTAFLLMLITVSGAVLVIQRQRGLRRFFSRIVRDNFAQYYHVVLGRLTLIPIFLVALTGVYLSLQKFGLFPEKKITHEFAINETNTRPNIKPADFPAWQNIRLSEVQKLEYPFSDDPEDYYLLKLKDREIVVDQFTGKKLSEVEYPFTTIMTNLSLDVHTGRRSIVWSIVLAIASINILFFIYSGFVIMRKRTRSRIRNKYKAADSRFIILVGTENGSTLRYANAIHQQLLACGQMAFITELNKYTSFPKAEHIVVVTATYGLGNAPTNANKFAALLKTVQQDHPVNFSVVGFGSHAYPDFCRFAFDADNLLSAETWARPFLEIHTVNDRSPEQFTQWFTTWSQKAKLPPMTLPVSFTKKPAGLQQLSVLGVTNAVEADHSFMVRLQAPRRGRFTSGDLLAIYPADDHRERLYSIGKINNEIHLSVKLQQDGLGSGYLYRLQQGDTITARINANEHFRFPQKVSTVVMISNGTGIAPFLGMIDENNKKTDCHLYAGFRLRSSFKLYEDGISRNAALQKVKQVHVAYSREGARQYVSDLLKRDAAFIADTLERNGTLMICGSLSMHHDVVALLEAICMDRTGKGLSFYQSRNQVLSDCY